MSVSLICLTRLERSVDHSTEPYVSNQFQEALLQVVSARIWAKVKGCNYTHPLNCTSSYIDAKTLLWKKTALKQLVLKHVNNKFIVLTAMILLKYAGPGTYM